MPTGKAISQVKTSAVNERTMVRPSRAQIRSETGLSQSKDWPKSPREDDAEIQIQYCIQIGSSSP